MSVPITARLDEQAVEPWTAPSPRVWRRPEPGSSLRRLANGFAAHGEEAIAESYRRRYKHTDAAEANLVAKVGAFSAAGCLDSDDR